MICNTQNSFGQPVSLFNVVDRITVHSIAIHVHMYTLTLFAPHWEGAQDFNFKSPEMILKNIAKYTNYYNWDCICMSALQFNPHWPPRHGWKLWQFSADFRRKKKFWWSLGSRSPLWASFTSTFPQQMCACRHSLQIKRASPKHKHNLYSFVIINFMFWVIELF